MRFFHCIPPTAANNADPNPQHTINDADRFARSRSADESALKNRRPELAADEAAYPYRVDTRASSFWSGLMASRVIELKPLEAKSDTNTQPSSTPGRQR